MPLVAQPGNCFACLIFLRRIADHQPANLDLGINAYGFHRGHGLPPVQVFDERMLHHGVLLHPHQRIDKAAVLPVHAMPHRLGYV